MANTLVDKLRIITNSFQRISEIDWLATALVATNQRKLLCWANAHQDKRNFGDKLNEFLFEEITSNKVVHYSKVWNIFKKNIYYFIGSILDNLNTPNAIVCGAGFQKVDAKIIQKPLSIIAVRGPLTRKIFLNNNIDCPEIYCDPAMLLPTIYPNRTLKKEWDVGIIPHYVDKQRLKELELIAGTLTYKIIDIELPPKEIIDLICRSRYVFSSSLHGLIAAHSYNIPATWLKISNNVIGGDFKFHDYLLSVGASNGINPYEVVNNILDLKEGVNRTVLFDTMSNAKKFIEAMRKG